MQWLTSFKTLILDQL